MTRFKQNKFYKSSKINGNYVAVPLSSDKTTSQIDQGLDQLTKGKEALRWERIGLLEDRFVQAVAKEKGIPLAQILSQLNNDAQLRTYLAAQALDIAPITLRRKRDDGFLKEGIHFRKLGAARNSQYIWNIDKVLEVFNFWKAPSKEVKEKKSFEK